MNQITKNRFIGFSVALLVIVGGVLLYSRQQSTPNFNAQKAQNLQSENYNPSVSPSNFTTEINNIFFSIKPGQKTVFEAKTPNGTEKIVITIEKNTKNVAGFETLIYHDQVYIDNVLKEDTRDYLAQHKKTGDVWYFGEEVDNYENGTLKDHHGTFLHGTDGAEAGIWIKANQNVGDSYRQEYYKGQAEDMQNVVAIDQTVKTAKATYTGCVKLYAWTPLDKQSQEFKYNCPEINGEVLIENQIEGKRTELVSITKP